MSSSTSPYRCNPPYHPDRGEPARPVLGRKMYLVCGRLVKKPGFYTSWPSADAQYKGVSGASIKGYHNYDDLVAAWHTRCDLGEHDHATDPLYREVQCGRAAPPPPSPVPSSPASREPPPSPPLRLYYIHSRSPTRTPSPMSRTPSPVPTARTHGAPPDYTAIFGHQGPSNANSTNAGRDA
ncbi:hypothetical protein C8R45DRAFT_1101995 [Mycena sanguinolenta]|nr:hypothetical protein C8R45DRAFT_1101995 [Mycena sanguinolenta]